MAVSLERKCYIVKHYGKNMCVDNTTADNMLLADMLGQDSFTNEEIMWAHDNIGECPPCEPTPEGDVVDTSKDIKINVMVSEGHASIADLKYPSTVKAGEPFDISCNLTNTGAKDTIFIEIYDAGLKKLVPNSRHEETMATGEAKNIRWTITINKPITLHWIIRAGHLAIPPILGLEKNNYIRIGIAAIIGIGSCYAIMKLIKK